MIAQPSTRAPSLLLEPDPPPLPPQPIKVEHHVVHLRPQESGLPYSELEHEVLGKAAPIPANLLLEAVWQQRPVNLLEHVPADGDPVVGRDAEDVGMEGGGKQSGAFTPSR